MARQTLTKSQYEAWRKKNAGQDVEIINKDGQVEDFQRGDKGFLGNIITGVTDPFVNLTKAAIEGKRKLEGANDDSVSLLTAKERRNLPRYVLQNAAGAASNFVPGGSTVAGMAGRSAIGAALASVGAQDIEKDIDLGEVAKDTVIGGVTGAALGKLSGAGSKVENKALKEGAEEAEGGILKTIAKKGDDFLDNQEFGSFQRRLGSKAPDQRVMPDFKRLGFTGAKDADDLVVKATQVVEDQGSKIRPAIEKLDGSGTRVAADDVTGKLDDLLNDKTMLPSEKSVVQKVKEDVKAVFDLNEGELTPSQLYDLKQKLGRAKADFKANPSTIKEGALYADVYNSVNDKIDEMLTGAGFSDFRKINQDVSTAFDALDYAQRSSKKAVASRPLNLLDVVTSAGGLAGGGPGGMAGAAAASKILQSRAAEDAAIGAGRKGMNFLRNLSDKNIKVPAQVQKVAGNQGVKQLLPGILSRSQGQEAPQEGGEVAEGGFNLADTIEAQEGKVSQAERSQYFNELMQQGYKPSEAKTIVEETFGAVKEKSATDKKTVAQAQTGMRALEDISKLLEEDPNVLGGTALPFAVQPEKSKSLSSAITRAVEMIGRMQSGGAIQKEEAQRFEDMLPKPWKLDSKENIRKNLSELYQQLAYVAS